MQSPNPYRTPTADVQPPVDDGSDLTPFYTPAGRFGRLSYLAWVMVMSVASWLIVMALTVVGLIELPVDAGGAQVPGLMPDMGPVGLTVWILINLISLVIVVIFAVRRCHDIDISGWWNLLMVIPVVNLVFVLFLILKPGTEGANRFGPPRETPGWEKVVGIIGVVFFGLAVIGIVAAIAIPFFVS